MKALPLPVAAAAGQPFRWRPIAAIAAVALLAAWLWPATDEDEIAAPTAAARSVTTAATAKPAAPALLQFVKRASTPAARDLFAGHSWYRPPPPPPPAPPAVAAAPTAPPLPYAFLGQYERTGDKAVYFLVRGDRVFDVKVGDTLESTYTVDAATEGALQLTYLPLQIKQALSIGRSE